MRYLLPFVSLTLALGLNACAHFQSNSQNSDSALNDQTDTGKPQEIEFGNFSQSDDTLYDLLVAEIAAQRDQFTITLVNYIQQARVTRDPAIILRAINAAQIAKDQEAIKELALLWLEIQPNNIGAHQILAFQYSLEKAFPEAMDQIAEILELGGQTSVEALAVGSQTASEEEKTELLGLYEDLLERFPDNGRYATVSRLSSAISSSAKSLFLT